MNDTDNELHLRGGINLSMQGAYRVQVVDYSTKSVIRDYGWHKNLILNSGMNAITGTSIASLTSVGVVGTGSRPNSITSSTQQITQSGQYIYLDNTSSIESFTQSFSTYGSLVSVGDLIIDEDNSQSYVISVVSSSLLYVDTNYTYNNTKSFVVWKTSQKGLEKEVHRISNYLIGSSSLLGWNCGTYVSGTTTVNRRTYDFQVETLTMSYSEIGTSWTNTANKDCFSRVVLPFTTSLSPGQQLRMTYDLFVSYGPNVPTYKTASIVGWPVSPSTSTIGTESIQSFIATSVNTNGTSTGLGTGGSCALDPAVTSYSYGGTSFFGFSVFISSDSRSLVTGSGIVAGGAIARSLNTEWVMGNPTSYVVATGSYGLIKTATHTIYQSNLTDIRSIGMGSAYNPNGYGWSVSPYDAMGQAMTFVFDEPQTKTNLQTLTLSWKWNWYRVIQ